MATFEEAIERFSKNVVESISDPAKFFTKPNSTASMLATMLDDNTQCYMCGRAFAGQEYSTKDAPDTIVFCSENCVGEYEDMLNYEAEDHLEELGLELAQDYYERNI